MPIKYYKLPVSALWWIHTRNDADHLQQEIPRHYNRRHRTIMMEHTESSKIESRLIVLSCRRFVQPNTSAEASAEDSLGRFGRHVVVAAAKTIGTLCACAFLGPRPCSINVSGPAVHSYMNLDVHLASAAAAWAHGMSY